MHTTNNAIQVTNELMNQGMKTDGIQYYNIHQKLILLDLVTESDIYNNYSYASFADLEIEKTSLKYLNSNSNTLVFLWTTSTQQARRLFV